MTKSKTDELVERIEPKLSKFSCVNGDVQELLKDCKIHILEQHGEVEGLDEVVAGVVLKNAILKQKLERLKDTETLMKIIGETSIRNLAKAIQNYINGKKDEKNTTSSDHIDNDDD